MRKAQFEIMGLAIVVVLISIGVFFLLSFGLQQPEDPASQFFEQQYAQNAVDALIQTSLDGCSGTVADYIADYADGALKVEGLPCETEEGMEAIGQALRSGMRNYGNYAYRFEVRGQSCDNIFGGPSCDVLYEDGVDCDPAGGQYATRAGKGLVSRYPAGFAEVVLWICPRNG